MNWLKQQAANIAGTQEPIHGPSACQPVTKQAETTPYTELKKEDLRWAVMDSTCVETQTFYLFAESGHIGMAQLIYNNFNDRGIHTTCQFNSKIFYPDEKTPHLWCSDTVESHGFDADKLSFHADGCAITLDDAGSTYTVKSVVNENCVVNFTMTKQAPGFQVGKDGKTFFGTDPKNPWGSMRHAFWPRCSVNGSMITKSGQIDFKGRGIFIHALQGMKPHHAAAKWNFINFHTPTYSAVMMEFTTPPSYGSTVVNVGGIVTDEKILYAGASNTAQHTQTKEDPQTEWKEPTAIKCVWDGKSMNEGTTVHAELSGELGKRSDRVDIMAKVPGVIKTIVGGVAGTKPYIYQFTSRDQLEFKVKVGEDGEKVEKGTLLMEATFIS